MEEKSLSFSFSARYYTEGTLNGATRQVWIVLHGYGQLARFFIKKFEKLADQNIYVLAPEGISTFYLSELTGQGRKDNKVGATWMTSENRLTDIDNYVHFLDALYEKELKAFPHVPVTVLGFSQGCATACRWAVRGEKIVFNKLILWAGLFPPDMDFKAGHELLAHKQTFMVVGDHDPYLTAERMKEFDQLAAQLGIQPEKITFAGKHEIREEVFPQLIG